MAIASRHGYDRKFDFVSDRLAGQRRSRGGSLTVLRLSACKRFRLGACIGLYLKEKLKAGRLVFAHGHKFNYDNPAAKLSKSRGPKWRHMDEPIDYPLNRWEIR